MVDYTQKIQEIAKTLLSEKKVDVVIGFKQGSLPEQAQPCMISKPEDADLLVWNAQCRLNLANYLPGRKERIGIVAKGCDSRNISLHIAEHKIERDQLVIIGVPCSGMADKDKLARSVKGDITAIDEDKTSFAIQASGTKTSVAKTDVMQENCLTCTHPNPVIFDETVAAFIPETSAQPKYEAVTKIDTLAPDDKWAFFESLFAACTRCYACKNACPLCYCPTCFVDESTPQWVGKGDDPVDIRTFHTLRAFHCAGRCTDCGACEAACPMQIKVRLLTGKLNQVCEDLYHYEAGLSPDIRPALDTFRLDDPEAFIK